MRVLITGLGDFWLDGRREENIANYLLQDSSKSIEIDCNIIRPNQIKGLVTTENYRARAQSMKLNWKCQHGKTYSHDQICRCNIDRPLYELEPGDHRGEHSEAKEKLRAMLADKDIIKSI
jgi:hypothetical protein